MGIRVRNTAPAFSPKAIFGEIQKRGTRKGGGDGQKKNRRVKIKGKKEVIW
jgi:hypothetical protein